MTDAIWPFLYDIDPGELEEDRLRMKMNLARYARQNLLQWDDVEVGEIRKWHRVLKELLDQENSVTNTEDR